MNFMCKVFGHKWNDGCTCVRCNQKRNENHKWENIPGTCKMKCTVCGAEKTIPHDWDGCICKNCQEVKDVHLAGHRWRYLEENSCLMYCHKCEQNKMGNHKWDVCVCKRCGMKRETYTDQLKNGKPLLKHIWRPPLKDDVWWKESTRTGMCYLICDRCGFVWKFYSHDWKDDVCQRCGRKKEDYLCNEQMSSHKWEKIGDCRKKCSRCGIIAYDHDYLVIDSPNHLTEDSWYKYRCKNCGHEAFENSNMDSRQQGFIKE